MASLPKKIDCRVDYREINGNKYSFLVNYGSEDFVVYYTPSEKGLNELYSDFKFVSKSKLTIDNFPLTQLPYSFKKIKGLVYGY